MIERALPSGATSRRRELNTASLPTRNFINERLTFTHGMGIAMAPVNQVHRRGVARAVSSRDLPPVSTVSVKVTRPQIYYGELTKQLRLFVGTGQKEFDYPAGEEETSTRTTPVAAAFPIGSFLLRALYAWELGSTDILLSLVHLARTRASFTAATSSSEPGNRPAISGFSTPSHIWW